MVIFHSYVKLPEGIYTYQMLHVVYLPTKLAHKNGVNVGELSSSMEHMGILGDGHLSFHRALHTNYARISRKRMKNGVAQMDGSLGNQPADLKPPALQKTP